MDNNNDNLEENQQPKEQNQEPAPPETLIQPEPPKKPKPKKLAAALIAALLLGGGVAVWYFTQDSSGTDELTNTSQNNSQNSVQTETPKNTAPNTVAYSFREDPNKPYAFYWRPALGGERTEAQKLTSGENVASFTANKNQIAVLTYGGGFSNAIWYSSDGGKKYQKIFSEPEAPAQSLGPQITSMVFSTDGKALAFGYLPENKLNTVKEIQFDNSNKVADLFTADSPGIFLEGYSRQDKKILFFKGCYNCDGNSNRELFMRDLERNSTTSVIKSTKGGYEVDVKSDFSEILVIQGSDDSATSEGIPSYFDLPYQIFKQNLTDAKITELANISQASGTETGLISAGYNADEKNAYYHFGKQLFNLKDGGSPGLLFEAGKPILDAFYVSDTYIITSSGDDFENFTLSRFNLTDKKTETILTGDGETRIFGITHN